MVAYLGTCNSFENGFGWNDTKRTLFRERFVCVSQNNKVESSSVRQCFVQTTQMSRGRGAMSGRRADSWSDELVCRSVPGLDYFKWILPFNVAPPSLRCLFLFNIVSWKKWVHKPRTDITTAYGSQSPKPSFSWSTACVSGNKRRRQLTHFCSSKWWATHLQCLWCLALTCVNVIGLSLVM